VKADGFITAGGNSSRMGRDKAWLELDGVTMIERVIAALRPVTARVTIIANRPEYTRLNLPSLPTRISASARSKPSEPRWPAPGNRVVALVGCDLPFVTSDLFRYLLRVGGGAQAVVPLDEEGQIEPLCAIYSTAALGVVAALIADGERKVSRLFERIPTRFVAFEELRHLEGAGLLFENINSRADYQRALRRLNPPH
jgi:molybdopterin-guanine dinucleotide biosynthesis protein A